MKTTKQVLSGIWRLGRGTATAMGVAVMLALIVGLASAALAAAPGDPFRLGQNNTIDVLTSLVGTNAGGALLKVDNNSADAGSRALDLRVEPGRAPMSVTAGAGKVTNLDADKLDGKGADQIGVNGLEVVVDGSATNSDSPKTAFADCPDGKVLVGTGYELIGGTSGASREVQTDVVVTDVEPSTFTNDVDVTAFEEDPTTAEWLVQAHAICAAAP